MNAYFLLFVYDDFTYTGLGAVHYVGLGLYHTQVLVLLPQDMWEGEGLRHMLFLSSTYDFMEG